MQSEWPPARIYHNLHVIYHHVQRNGKYARIDKNGDLQPSHFFRNLFTSTSKVYQAVIRVLEEFSKALGQKTIDPNTVVRGFDDTWLNCRKFATHLHQRVAMRIPMPYKIPDSELNREQNFLRNVNRLACPIMDFKIA
jgi:hypothetical protein